MTTNKEVRGLRRKFRKSKDTILGAMLAIVFIQALVGLAALIKDIVVWVNSKIKK